MSWAVRWSAAVAAALAGLACSIATGCHVESRTTTTRPLAVERIAQPDGAIARRPALVWTPAGRLRFVAPLECPTEEIVRQHATLEVTRRPNLATFTVGVIAAAVGGVMLTTGLFSADASNLYTYAGVAGVSVGLPLAIGPWLGNRTELYASTGAQDVRRPGPSQPCGERAVAARAATLTVGGIQVHGAIDADGVFAVSPYQWIDAYGAASAVALAVTATLELAGGERTVEAVLEADAIARHAAGYLANGGAEARGEARGEVRGEARGEAQFEAQFEAQIEPFQRVTGLVAGAPRASLAATDAGLAVRVSLPLRNDGPGDAWGVRGHIVAPAIAAIDGRVIYVGALRKGAAVTRELAIPVAPATASALRGQLIELAIELRDAHGTAPATPVRFRGPLVDAPPR